MIVIGVVVLFLLLVVGLGCLLCWDFSPINESDDSLRVLVPILLKVVVNGVVVSFMLFVFGVFAGGVVVIVVVVMGVVMLCILCVDVLNGLFWWGFSPINESDDSLRVLVPVAVSCHIDCAV